jgi:hypothetical protein
MAVVSLLLMLRLVIYVLCYHSHVLAVLVLSLNTIKYEVLEVLPLLILVCSVFYEQYETSRQPFAAKIKLSLGPFYTFSAELIMVHHLLCPIHALHKFIITINYKVVQI